MTMIKRRSCMAALLAVSMLLTGCVDQSQGASSGSAETAQTTADTTDVQTMLQINDPEEKAAVEAAKKKVASMKEEPRIIATSPAVADICDKLGLDLVGVCKTASDLPERYQDLTQVGTAMSPDMEIVSSLNPDWLLSPSSLQSDLQPKYEAIDTDWAFLNLKSVFGMYRSIQELGEIFGKEQEAQQLVDEFTTFYEEYQSRNDGKEGPDVLILMGLPGSYIVATENSYVGSLVEMAGGNNVYAGSDSEFLNINTEDMKDKEPDVILLTAHALPDQVMEMFDEEFKTNDIWKHFDAVKNDRVYNLTYEYFGMSATFNYENALNELQPIFYPESEADEQKARENSDNARQKAADSDASEKLGDEAIGTGN